MNLSEPLSRLTSLSFEGQVAVVTGAGRGIGLGIAEAFCQQGAVVVIGELVAERGQAAVDRLHGQGFSALALPVDVTQPASCQALVDLALASYGRIDILVNNAGVFVLDRSEDLSPENWRFQVEVLLNGTFFMTQAVARRAMIPQRRGSIVNIGSIAGMGGWPMRSAYNAAKAGVINLTETLAGEWAQYNIRINCVSPGVTRTEMNEESIRKGAANMDKYDRRSPMGRIAEVHEIASAVVFLASDRANFITGANLRVDGGWVPWGNLHALGFPEANNG